ncbi:hypothetical protein OG496_17075 [Streptomyces sp. NBC_00988]|uniref:hypothetical protein n=1 Tax=Streptomyces sp. NBC_00988 TaxID=2903704 RepID=UPI00386E1792|nr:hypothetical protein OG496_17075 [Streptomyces sp. NBC_00988]
MTTLDERHGEGAREAAGAYRPDAAVPLDQLTAIQPLFAGSKAANLARAAQAGLPVLPGFVIPEGAGDDPATVRRAWRDLSDSGTRPLVVRSSSPQEDTEQSSLAGQFASVLVTGVLLSGLAWVVQRIASATGRPAERRLAGRLAVLTAPEPGAVVGELEDRPALGRRAKGRAARTAVVGVVGAALLAALVVGLADLTQTREQSVSGSEATSVLVQVDVRGADMTAERQALAAQQVWERCRDSTSVPLNHATLGSLGDGMFAGVVRPALAEHDRMRLRGCLEDAALDRAHLTVMGMGDTDADDD